jgi:nicotinamide-nucleotide adenylyltransferase/phosphinothricin biosynthesis protein PhpF
MAGENREDRVEIGCVHGRYQPFHLGHLEYVLKAHELSRLLYVGLSNSEPFHINADATSAHRHLDSANPFPYFARMEMVLGSLKECSADLERIRIIPFPINRPELLRYYVPSDAVHMITVFDDWGEKKLKTLSGLGLRVEVLSMRKVTTGSEVRRRISNSEPFTDLVPPFVDRYLKSGGQQYLLALP